MLVVLAVMPSVARADGIPSLVMPKTSQWKAMGKVGLREPVSFKGQEQVSGDLMAEWVSVGAGVIEPTCLIVPDASSAARLPHFKGYGIRVIDIDNGEETLAMMLGDEHARLLISDHHMKRLRVHGTFAITDHEMSIECDAPWARARVRSAERLQALASVPESKARC
jgi:hypothetical protein